MDATATASLTVNAPEEVQRTFERLHGAYERMRYPTHATRLRWLRSLLELVEGHEGSLASAISADFGHRSRFEIALTEVFLSVVEIKHALKHLKGWMRPERVPTPLHLQPGRARIERQPVGVVGIICPWNYPLLLSISPTAGALAAGNRVLLKPSELTPRFADLLQKLVTQHFTADEFAVVTGTRELGAVVSRLPLNHLVFTGSTAIGREVAKAAAERLTPVTLELGGKSPAIIGSGAEPAKAARSVISGKLLNAGQTCIAPDYCLVPRPQLQRFASELANAVAKMFPNAAANPDYTSVINDEHLGRLRAYVEEARRSGATIVTLGPADPETRRMPLQIVVDPPAHLALMREEVFGPVLPVLPYETLDEAIAVANAASRPLALYFFGDDPIEQRRICCEIVAGGLTINDTLLHFAHPGLPFGGSGTSGMGAYHGQHGFRRFSHEKGIYEQSRWNLAPLLYPPYGKTAGRVLKLLRRLV